MNSLIKIKPSALSAQAQRTADIVGKDKDAFINFYTNNRPDKMFVPVADFLAWKGIKVKSDLTPIALSSRVWTLIYRDIAASEYGTDDDMVIKKSANSSLLFDVDFLISYFDDVKSEVFAKVFGGQ